MLKCIHGRIRCNDCRESKTPFYRKYLHIRSRCCFTWDKDFKNYGGRGIKFEWETFNEFKEDMYPLYLKHSDIHGIKNTTIERIDVNGNYSKDNCHWVTLSVQANNKRNSRKFTIGKETKTLAQWSSQYGMSRQILRYRIENGLSIKQALTLKINHANKYRAAI